MGRSIITRFEADEGTYQFGYVQNWRDTFAEVVTNSTRLPGMHGGYDSLGRGSGLGEIAQIEVNFGLAVGDEDEMTSLLDELRGLAGWGIGKLWMQPANAAAPERYCWARLNNINTPHNLNKHSDLMQRPKIVFQATYPRWLVDGEDHSIALGTDGEDLLFDADNAIFDDVVFEGTELALTNHGNAEALPILTYTATDGGGPLTIQRVVNDSTVADEISFAGIDTGEVLVIDTQSLSVTINGNDAYAYLSYENPSWIVLKPGVNALRILLGSGGGTLMVNFPHTYI